MKVTEDQFQEQSYDAGIDFHRRRWEFTISGHSSCFKL